MTKNLKPNFFVLIFVVVIIQKNNSHASSFLLLGQQQKANIQNLVFGQRLKQRKEQIFFEKVEKRKSFIFFTPKNRLIVIQLAEVGANASMNPKESEFVKHFILNNHIISKNLSFFYFNLPHFLD